MITINTGRRGEGYRVVEGVLLVLISLASGAAVGLYVGRIPEDWSWWVVYSSLLIAAWFIFVDMVYEGVWLSLDVWGEG